MKKMLLFISLVLICSNLYAKEQALKNTDETGITKWTDVYQGPNGSGYIDYEFKKENGSNYIRSKHVGSEARTDTNWTWVETITDESIVAIATPIELPPIEIPSPSEINILRDNSVNWSSTEAL